MASGAETKVVIVPREDAYVDFFTRRDSGEFEPTDNSCRNTFRTRLRPYLAVILGGLCAACISTTESIAKYTSNLGSANLGLYRNIYMSAFTLPVFLAEKQPVKSGLSKSWHLIAARIFLNATGYYLYFMGLKFIPLAEAAVVQSTWTILIAILSYVFFKESIDRYKLISIVINLCGVCSMSRIPNLILFSSELDGKYTSKNYWFGFGCALGCAVCLAGEAIILRKLRDAGDLFLAYSLSTVSSVLCVATSGVEGNLKIPRCGLESVLMLLLGVFGAIAQPLRTQCFKLEDATVVAVLITAFRVLFNILIQVFLFRDTADGYTIAAGIFMASSVVVCVLKKRAAARGT